MPKNLKKNLNAETPILFPPSPEASTTKRSSTETRSAVKPKSAKQPWNEVRTEMVERARKLVQDVNYPPAEVMRQVADLLAQNLHGLRR